MELIGRASELSLIGDLLRARRLVTLVGPGGIGKTALARAVVTRCQDAFSDGCRIVDVTRVDSTAAVYESLAAQLDYRSFRALVDTPGGDRSVLVLVDSCEHVVDTVADALGQVLDACQMPTVLATSRIALELPGETVVPVGPLALPAPGASDAPATRLFLERSREAGADLEGADTIGVVAELCRRLDGVPLAIELAAARSRAMTPSEILERLGRGLDVLDRPRRRAAARHRSLRAAIGWSYDVLADEERRLFDRLSVFSGPFSVASAHAVAGSPGTVRADTQDILARLVSASMVVADPIGDTTWYRELDTLRAFARERLEQLGERHLVQLRFVDHVVEQAAGIIEDGVATWSASALRELHALYENITAALRWCLGHDRDPHRALLLVAVLWGVVHQAHTEEIGELAEQVLAHWPDTEDPLRTDAAATAATCRSMLGDYGASIALAEKALVSADASPFAPATLRRAIAHALRATGDADAAAERFADTVREARRLHLVAFAVEADAARAQILADLGQVDEAVRVVDAARCEAEAGASELAACWARTVEGSILLRVDVERAAATAAAALTEGRRLRYAAAIATNLRTLAQADVCQGDTGAAAVRVLELLDELLHRGSTYELRFALDTASAILARCGRRAVAADLAATARSLPVVGITASVGHELLPLDPTGGKVLVTREAIGVTRAELEAVVEETTQSRRQADAADATSSRPDLRVGVFRRSGELWEIGYGERTATMRPSKGMDDIARLIAADGKDVHCLELIGTTVHESDTGEVLDAAARRAYEARVRELQEDLDEADAAGDLFRAERARTEMDAIVDQLTAALGLGGRARRTGGAAERARSAVTQRIRSTIRRIDGVHPRLGRHLRSAIRTGFFCSYTPEEPTRWQL